MWTIIILIGGLTGIYGMLYGALENITRIVYKNAVQQEEDKELITYYQKQIQTKLKCAQLHYDLQSLTMCYPVTTDNLALFNMRLDEIRQKYM